MTNHKLEMETVVMMERIGNTNQYSLTLLYADPEISTNYPSLGVVLLVGEENEIATHFDLYQQGYPTPQVLRALEDVYEGALKKFLFPRLFGAK